MACPNCKSLDITYDIGSDDELCRTVEITRGEMDQGRLLENPIISSSAPKFSKLRLKQNIEKLPEDFEYRFRCPKCATQFSLVAEQSAPSVARWEPFRGRK